jgi:hypothetical protein
MNDIASWIWVLIPLAAIGIAPFRMWLRMKERQIAHTERLEQRMRVLERIITDKGIDVADQIESLRDKPLN